LLYSADSRCSRPCCKQRHAGGAGFPTFYECLSMIHSMTGYAAASRDLGSAMLNLEIKSVN
jgi:hypothetical protein